MKTVLKFFEYKILSFAFLAGALIVACPFSFAQVGCPGQLPTGIIAGPDSTQTDGDQTFRSLAVNPWNSDIVYVGSEGNGMFRSYDGGNTWSWLRQGLRIFAGTYYAETWDLALNPADTSVMYVAMTGSPGPVSDTYPSSNAGVYKSTNSGNTWDQRNCNLPNAKASAVWVDPQYPDTVFVALEAGAPSFSPAPDPYYIGGIFRSTDGGLNWFPVTMPASADSQGYWRVSIRSNAWITYGLRWPSDKSLGFLQSTDRGQTWQLFTDPLAGKMIAEFSVSGDGQIIYAVSRDSNAVYSSMDGGNSWNKISIWVNGTVAVHPLASDTVFFSSGNFGNVLYKSRIGITSSNLNDPGYKIIYTFPKYIEEIVFSPSNPCIMYVATRGLGIYRSDDCGETFQELVKLRVFMELATGIKQTDNPETDRSVILSGCYPNPFSNEISLYLPVSGMELKIFNVLGKIVFQKTLNAKYETLNLDLPNGIYFLQIKNDNFVETKKLEVIK